MGVIRLYAELIQQYPCIVNKKIDHIDHLYIDFNAIVYNTISQLDKDSDSKMDTKSYSYMLIKEVVKSLICLITTMDPKKSVYVAVDGPAPSAKMVQQRDRRYKSLLEKKFIKEIEAMHGIVNQATATTEETVNVNKWTTAYISPGTVFMTSLEKELEEGLKQLKVKYVFSGSKEAGEGEHKIINLMNKECSQEGCIDDIFVVHSPDNDLIVLLSTIQAKVYLIRNEDQDITKPYVFIDILMLIDNLFLEYGQIDHDEKEENLIDAYNYKRKRFAKDYAFLTYFCGNDFIKAVPYLKIKERNTHLLLTTYQELQKELNDYLVNDSVINVLFLKKLIDKIAEHELSLLQSMQRKRHYTTKNTVAKNTEELATMASAGMEKKDLLERDIKNFEHAVFYDHRHPFFDRYNYLFSKIDYYNEDYIKMYNDYFFKGHDIKSVYIEYLRSFQFVLNYYSGHIDQRYYYKYRAAPLFIGLKNIPETEFVNIFNDMKFDFKSRPVTEYEQLLAILPTQLFHILPKHIVQSMPLKLMNRYRNVYNLSLDVVQGTKYIYSSLILGDLFVEDIIKYVESIETTKIIKN